MWKVLPTYCFCGVFQGPRCWWYRWMTRCLSLSCSLINSLSWQCCWGKHSHPAHTTVVCFHFSITSVSSWILPHTCSNRKDGEARKHYYLWGVEEARSAHGLCQWKLFMMLWLHMPSPTCLFTATSHTLLSDVSYHDSVSLMKLVCLCACL